MEKSTLLCAIYLNWIPMLLSWHFIQVLAAFPSPLGTRAMSSLGSFPMKKTSLLCAMYPTFILQTLRQEVAENGLVKSYTVRAVEEAKVSLEAMSETHLCLTTSALGPTTVMARPTAAMNASLTPTLPVNPSTSLC